MLVCAYNVHSCTRDRGCSAHPAFPAPSIFEGEAKNFASLGRNRAARSRMHTLSPRRPGERPTACTHLLCRPPAIERDRKIASLFNARRTMGTEVATKPGVI